MADRSMRGAAGREAARINRLQKAQDRCTPIPEQGIALVEVTASPRPAVIDIEDLPRVGCHSWRLNSKGYPRANINRRTVTLHRHLMGKPPAGHLTDHQDGDRLNNRQRTNLRFVTREQSNWNRGRHRDSGSALLGVRLQDDGKCVGVLSQGGKAYRTQPTACPMTVAFDRDKLARKLRGPHHRSFVPGFRAYVAAFSAEVEAIRERAGYECSAEEQAAVVAFERSLNMDAADPPAYCGPTPPEPLEGAIHLGTVTISIPRSPDDTEPPEDDEAA